MLKLAIEWGVDGCAVAAVRKRWGKSDVEWMCSSSVRS